MPFHAMPCLFTCLFLFIGELLGQARAAVMLCFLPATYFCYSQWSVAPNPFDSMKSRTYPTLSPFPSFLGAGGWRRSEMNHCVLFLYRSPPALRKTRRKRRTKRKRRKERLEEKGEKMRRGEKQSCTVAPPVTPSREVIGKCYLLLWKGAGWCGKGRGVAQKA